MILGFTRFLESALRAGNAAIVLATESHRKSLLQSLQPQGVDIVAVNEQDRYISLDIAETLATFMATDLPDPVRFLKVAGDLIVTEAKAAKSEHPRVAACGECTPLLWTQGKADAAIQLEHLWDGIAKTTTWILCAGMC